MQKSQMILFGGCNTKSNKDSLMLLEKSFSGVIESVSSSHGIKGMEHWLLAYPIIILDELALDNGWADFLPRLQSLSLLDPPSILLLTADEGRNASDFFKLGISDIIEYQSPPSLLLAKIKKELLHKVEFNKMIDHHLTTELFTAQRLHDVETLFAHMMTFTTCIIDSLEQKQSPELSEQIIADLEAMSAYAQKLFDKSAHILPLIEDKNLPQSTGKEQSLIPIIAWAERLIGYASRRISDPVNFKFKGVLRHVSADPQLLTRFIFLVMRVLGSFSGFSQPKVTISETSNPDFLKRWEFHPYNLTTFEVLKDFETKTPRKQKDFGREKRIHHAHTDRGNLQLMMIGSYARRLGGFASLLDTDKDSTSLSICIGLKSFTSIPPEYII